MAVLRRGRHHTLVLRAVTGLLDADPATGAAEVERRDGGRCVLADSLAAAVDWLCRRVDDDPHGLLTYRRLNPRGIENQTWRDSWDSLSHADGGLPDRDRPVAALDVQALAYDALAAAARHLRARDAEGASAAGALEKRAQMRRVRSCQSRHRAAFGGMRSSRRGRTSSTPTGLLPSSVPDLRNLRNWTLPAPNLAMSLSNSDLVGLTRHIRPRRSRGDLEWPLR